MLWFAVLMSALFALGITASALYLIPGLFKKPLNRVLEVELEDPVVVVSDIHNDCSLPPEFLNKIKEIKPKAVVFAGDLFDEAHKPVSVATLKKMLEPKVMLLPDSVEKVVYVLSLASHDPIVRDEVIELEYFSRKVIVIKRCLKLSTNSLEVYITHGDISCPNGALAHIINRLASLIGVSLFLEKLLKRRLEDRCWLIMGHTHIPGICQEYRVANTGSWKEYYRRASKSFVLINGDRVQLIFA